MGAPAVQEQALATRLQLLTDEEDVAPDLAEQLGAMIRTGTDGELFRTNPLRFAATHDVAETHAIDLFLLATHVGILEFSWGILCPSCGAFLTTDSGVQWLHTSRHCDLCVMEISVDVDVHVEVAFTVAPTVRRIRFHELDDLDFTRDGLRAFFSSSIAHHPEVHEVLTSAIRTGVRVQGGGRATLEFDVERGHHLLMAPSSHAVCHVRVEDDAPHQAELEVLFDGVLHPREVTIAPGPGRIEVRNRSERHTTVGLMQHDGLAPTPPEERSGALYTVTPFLSGERLLTNQVFNDLFRGMSVPSEHGLEIKQLTIMFTDLTSSTAMYRELGDLEAFALVRRHFDVLREVVATHGGVVVKTIGDAVMAAFSTPAAALQAAIGTQDELERLNGPVPLTIKVGVHAGPCLAVELNQRLDYFGQTVNVAARLQQTAGAQEIACSSAVMHAAGVHETVRAGGLRVTTKALTLKGVTAAFDVHRICP